MEPFTSQLRKRAAELGISHAEVARRSGLGERRYGHYVAGVREPDLATLVRIAEALETTPNVLLGVGGPKDVSPRSKLADRLNSAANALVDADLETVAVQVEALTAYRQRKPSRKARSTGAMPPV